MSENWGFSLIELLVCLGIVLLLSTLAYPLYEGQIARAYRRQAQMHLLKLAQDLELYHSEHQEYAGFRPLISDKHYRFEVTIQNDNYLLKAIPQKGQAKRDKNCGALSLDNFGRKGISGKNNLFSCWDG